MRRLKDWYCAPGQFILRGEIRWFGRWLRRPGAWLWLGGYAILVLLPFSLFYRVSGSPLLFSYLYSGLFLAYRLALWLHLYQLRTLEALAPHRLAAVLAAPVEPKSIWPGLLAAPALGFFALACIGFAASFPRLVLFLLGGGFGEQFSLFSMLMSYLLGIPAGLIMSFLEALAVSAFAARWTAPSGGLAGAALAACLCDLFLRFMRDAPRSAVMALAGFGGYYRPYGAAMLIGTLAGSAVAAAIAWLVYWRCLKALRGGGCWEKLRRSVE